MFNLTDDPREQCDLIDDPAYIERKIEMLGRLIEVMNYPKSIMNYRNLPVIDGKKIPVHEDQFKDAIRYFPQTASPHEGGES